MKNFFETMHSVPTPAEQCKGFDILKYRDISKIKSSRLCKIDESITKETYVVEVITKTENGIQYKSYTFNTLSDAMACQNQL